MIAGSKYAMAAELFSNQAVGGCWNLGFIRSFNDWEIEEKMDYMMIWKIITIGECEDNLMWKPAKNGAFPTRSFYETYNRKMRGKTATLQGSLLPRVSFFAWESVKDS